MADCLFCEVIGGREPAFVVLDTPEALGFLDVRPLFPGHVLVAPKEHAETLTDLPVDDVGPFFTHVQRMAGAVERAMGSTGSFVAMNNRVSQSIPHLHVHVVPRTKGDGLRGFFWPRTKYASDDEAQAVADRIATEASKEAQ